MTLASFPLRILSVALVSISLAACGSDDGDSDSIAENLNPTDIQCVNGIPKNLKTQGSGFYDQEFFIWDTDYDSNDNEKLVINANQMKDGVLYEYSANLLKNSIAAYFAAIEIHNKPNFCYRYETTTLLLMNAWELMLKGFVKKYIKTKSIFTRDGHTISIDKEIVCI